MGADVLYPPATGADTDQRQDMANPSFAVATATSTVPAAFASEDHHTAQGKGKKKKKKNRSVVSQENGQGPLEGSSGGVRSKFGSGEEARECGGTGESGTVCPGTQPSPTVGKTLSLVEQVPPSLHPQPPRISCHAPYCMPV